MTVTSWWDATCFEIFSNRQQRLVFRQLRSLQSVMMPMIPLIKEENTKMRASSRVT